MQSCRWQTARPVAEFDLGVAYHAGTSEEFDAFRGRQLGRANVSLGFPFRLAADTPTSEVGISRCEQSGGWRYERIGPFTSRGGYDWWSIYWNGALVSDDELGRVGVAAHAASAIDAADHRAIPLPPLHVHHVHLAPSLGLHYRAGILPRCVLTGVDCLDASMLVQHHGDAQKNDGGLLYEDYGGPVKEVHRRLSVSGHLNDVRAAGSAPLTWFYAIGVRLVRVGEGPALSVHAFGQPGVLLPWRFSTYVVTMPANAGSVFYETARMPWSGNTHRWHFHSHQSLFRAADLYAATAPEVVARLAWEPPFATTRSWRDVGAVRAMLRANAPPDAHVCSAEHTPSTRGEDGVSYDRRARVSCRPWGFHRGDPLTVVAFLDADAPHGFEGMRTAGNTDGAAPQHVSWFLEFLCSDNTSHYTYSWTSSGVDAMDALATVRDTTRLFLHMQTPRGPPTVADEFLYAFGLLGAAYVCGWWWLLPALATAAWYGHVDWVIGAQGMALAVVYATQTCTYAFNDRDAAMAPARECQGPWLSVTLLIVGVHAALVWAIGSSRARRPWLL